MWTETKIFPRKVHYVLRISWNKLSGMTSGHFSALLFFCLQFLSPKRRDVSGMAPTPLQRLCVERGATDLWRLSTTPIWKGRDGAATLGRVLQAWPFIRVTVLSFRLTCTSVHQTISVAERNVLEKFHQLTVVLGCSPRCSSPRGATGSPAFPRKLENSFVWKNRK